MSKKAIVLDVILNILVAAFGATAFVSGFIKNGFSTFSFYTENSNLFAAISCSFYAAASVKSQGKMRDFAYALKYAATVCLTITFLVVFIVLAPMGGGLEGYKTMFFCDAMIFTHLLCPVLCVYSFVKFEYCKKPFYYAFFAVLPTLLYGAVMLVLNALKVIEGPYPFFFIYLNPVLAAVCCPLIFLGSFAVAVLLNARAKKEVKQAETPIIDL